MVLSCVSSREAWASAETRRASAIACQHKLKTKVTQSRAVWVLAESEISLALALVFADDSFSKTDNRNASMSP
jgi:uncharacterized protein YqfA (UPF0365 family)